MKKLITGILATLTCLACVACVDDNNSAGPTYDLTSANDYLKLMYKEADKEVRDDYEVVNTVTIDGVSYTVTWSVDVAEGVTVEAGSEGKSLINVDETLEADLDYVLTATIAAPDGTTKELTFNRKVLKAPSTVAMPIVAAPVEETAYKLYMYQVTKKGDSYFTGAMSGFYLGTNSDYNNAIDVFVENVEGKEGAYYLTFTKDDTKQYIGVTNTYNNGSWHDNAILAESTTVAEGEVKTFEFNFNDEYDIMTATLAGVKSGKDEATTETATVTYFLGTNKTYWTFGACELKDITAEDACIGKLVQIVDKSTVSAAEKIANEVQRTVNAITTGFSGDATYELPVAGATFTDVAIAWAVKEGASAAISGSTLTLTNPSANATVILTATVTCGETTETVDVEITHYQYLTPAEIVDAAYALAEGSAMDSAQTLTGTVVEIDTEYNAEYKNVSFVIVVDGKEDKPILCYRAKGDSAATIAVGHQATVTGTIKNYKGTIEFDAGCTIDACVTDATVSDLMKAIIDISPVTVSEIKDAGDVTLPVVGETYSATIAWASDNGIAVVNGATLTVAALPAEATDIVLTATVTVGEATFTKTFNVKVAAAPKANESVIDFSTYTAGVQYAEETHTLDENITMHITECHLNTQLRIYSSSSHDGVAEFISSKVITNVAFNAGNKVDTLNVYGSEDGTTWTLIEGVSITSTDYLDYSVAIENSTYKQIKLDVAGTQQVRIKTITFTYAD